MSDLSSDLQNSAPNPEIKNLTPITIKQRLVAMDILRGLALIGILLMNIEWFNRAISSLGSQDTSLSGLDHAVGWLIRCFVEGKFYTLFSLLFGMGFAVMLIRAKEAERPFGAWFSRRMIALIVFGLLHMIFLWGGDILQSYGVAGLLLLAWVTLLKKPSFAQYDNPKSFFKLAIVWLSVPIMISIVSAIGFGVSHDNDALLEQWHEEIKVTERVDTINLANKNNAESITDKLAEAANGGPENKVANNLMGIATDDLAEEDIEASIAQYSAAIIEMQAQAIIEQQQDIRADEIAENTAFTQGSYWQATEFRFDFALFMLMFIIPFSLTVLVPIFILGYWLVSSGIMQNYQQHSRAFNITAWLGIGLGLVIETSGLLVAQHPVSNQVVILQVVGEGLYYVGQLVMSAGYFGLIMYLLSDEKWRKRFAMFAPMGRMALTNYIMHSVILSSIFYGYAGGYFGGISRAPQMLIVLAIIIFQLQFSRWWLNHYAFGPLEWLWRCLSYKKIQTMRKL
ncbi:DUF418 domain-containing protein [Colwellia sp. Arc7-635]|uniref:DUF418 domain-containing protein n=1 Tax=Colwellia sp. Arc7-635 TaxID=2497879 RepID=UPI001F49CBF4|nr:DUF418 domain-containing protein [Colwellia sp. Arc7-635]